MLSSPRYLPAALLGACLLPSFAFADSTLTGDWGGLRSQMDADGIRFTGDYSGETVYNTHGGLKRSARYSQNLKLGVRFDLDKLLQAENAGVVQLTLNDRRGNDGSGDLVVNRLPLQENYGGLYTRLTELSYERTLFTPDLEVKLGYMAMGNDLGGLDSGILCNFMNAGFCGHPLNMSGGSGWTNYPNARLGVRVKYSFDPAWQLRVAAFAVDPESNGNSSRAWNITPKHKTGTVVPVELVYKKLNGLPGEYKVGWYYDSSDAKRIGSDEEVAGRGGHYVLLDQAVWQANDLAGQTLHVFGQAAAASSAASPFSKWYSVGLVLKQPFASRPNDTVSPGFGRAVPNPRSREVQEQNALANGDDFPSLGNAERLIELSYGYQATPWLTLRPDVQYVMEPGAFSGADIDNALVVGLQVKAAL